MHRHNNYEIMLYLYGNGVLHTSDNDYPFSPGTIIIVPPGIEHGSISENGFRNISVGSRFENLVHFKDVVTLSDNDRNEGKILAEMIYNNRYKNEKYLHSLCSAYIHFVMQNITVDSDIHRAVSQIICQTANNFYDSDINLCQLLDKSGYARDYIRSQFKRITQKTPNEFLTDMRIKHAVFLINIYSATLSLQQISEQCGYKDYVYFSKKFKKIMGMSPVKYKNMSSDSTKKQEP